MDNPETPETRDHKKQDENKGYTDPTRKPGEKQAVLQAQADPASYKTLSFQYPHQYFTQILKY